MAVSNDYLQYLSERFTALGEFRYRKMFGGVGLYLDDFFFAIVDDNTLYFKVDKSNRSDYEAADSSPFKPFGEDGYAMNYYELPAEILENNQELAIWTGKAVNVARCAKYKKKK